MATRTGHLSGRTGSKLETFLNQRLCHLLEEYLPDWCSVDYEHSLRHQQLGSKERGYIRKREKQLARDRSADATALGTMFIDLGEHLAKLDQGATLAFVFPLAGSSAPSAAGIRQLLAEWFHIEWIIASHDPVRTCFSENTDIAEMLVVARRHREADPARRPLTKFAVLRRNARSVVDATAVAAALHA